MLLSKHYNKKHFFQHICYHCNKWYGLIMSQTSQICTSHTMSYIVVKIVKNIVHQYKYTESTFLQELYQWEKENLFFDDKNYKKNHLWGLFHPLHSCNPYQWLKKKTKPYSTKGCSGDIWSHDTDKALRRGVADFLKCDWLAFLR